MLETRRRIKRETFFFFFKENISQEVFPFPPFFRNCVHLICNIDIHVCVCYIQFKSALFLYYQPTYNAKLFMRNTIKKNDVKKKMSTKHAQLYIKKKNPATLHHEFLWVPFSFFLLLHGITLIRTLIGIVIAP